jgi:hypothetical protein
MDNEPNPFPEFKVLPSLKDVGRFLLKCVTFLPEQTLASHGDHFLHMDEVNRGAAPALDEQLYSE